MSIARRASSRERATADTSADFQFPSNSHLLITCPSKIFSWDSTGINTIFRSRKGGIAAAREAKDGSGVLAIADKQVVVLHDTKRGQEKSWGLGAADDEVRHLEYTTDAKSLFLSTNLTADIQRYSTERARLLDPASIHASPPVTLAISPSGHAMVSASDHPPTIYLKNLAHNSSPILIEPRVSRAAVSVIAFHPERANIFLLAFRDGSVAAYDSNRIGRNSGGQFADQQGVSYGQISSFLKLHRATTESGKVPSITGAAFLPGFKTRAVTVGNDGRCRVIDFAGEGEVLRTWHAKAPVTSVSILSLKGQKSQISPFARKLSSHTIGGPTSTDSVLAIGRADGAVHLYDSVGLLLDHKPLGEGGERVVSVEWANGPSPRPIAETVMGSGASQAPSVPAKSPRRKPKAKSSLDASELKSADQTTESGLNSRRPFVIHPDEAIESIVRHTPLPSNAHAVPAASGPYFDLFSPVKPCETKIDGSSMRRVASPPRSRPRISSQTFVKSPEPDCASEDGQISKPRNIALFPSTDDTGDTVSPRDVHRESTLINAQGELPTTSARTQRISWKPSDRRRSRKSIGLRSLPAQPNDTAKVLADLRKMSTARQAERIGGVLSGFRRVGMEQIGSKGKCTGGKLFHRPTEHIETDQESLEALKEYDNARRESKWVEDSEQGDAFDGDIWLTSDSDKDTTRQTRRKQRAAADRPPARQTSRSRVTSKGTVSTCGKAPALVPTRNGGVDGSTEEDNGMQTAQSHRPPSGSFSPSSNDVRQLFPRSSSLSPHKRKHKHTSSSNSPAKPSQRRRDPMMTDRRTLREMTLNTVHTRQMKSPWEKVRAGKISAAPTTQAQPTAPTTAMLEDSGYGNGTDGISEGENEGRRAHCDVCGPTQARVGGLECEVARLRGEVLALKAVLRRNGLQVPRLS